MPLHRRLTLALAAPALLLIAAAPAITPGVGMKVPAFHAVTDTGKRVALADLAGRNGLVLAFVRSAKWCPFCQRQMIDFQTAQAGIEQRGYKLATVSYDDPQVLADFRIKHAIAYTMLSDHGSKMIDAFALRDPQYPPENMAYGVPHPTIYVIGRDGRVQARLTKDGYQVRPSLDALFAAIDAAAPGADGSVPAR